MLRMTDIAARAGVSQTTVSFVLNKHESSARISEDTRNRIWAAAEELGYRSNHLARSMRTGSTNMLGFIGGDLSSEHVGRMLDGALGEAEKQGFTLKMLPHREGQNGVEQIVRRASELRLSGIVALHLPPEMLELLRAETQQFGNAMVLLDTPALLDGVGQVMSDDENGVFLAVEHLVNLGHHRIAMISSDPPTAHTVVREQSFRLAMKRFGLEVPESFIAYGNFQQPGPSREAAQFLLGLPAQKRPTAIFCISDYVAGAVLRIAEKMALNVPRDVSLVGFGDLRVSQFSVPELTTVHQPFREMGERAVQRLIEQATDQSSARSDARSKARSQKVSEPLSSGIGNGGRAFQAQDDLATFAADSSNCEVERLPVWLETRESTAPPS